jgi:gliding motility-associated-like protein
MLRVFLENKWFLMALAFVFLFNTNSKGTHITGADLSYKCIGPNKFEFTLSVYRDCISLIDVNTSYDIDYSSLSCNKQGNITLEKVGYEDISPICPGTITKCAGGTQTPAIEKHIFKGTVTLPQCTDWVFSWRDCTRNSSIDNIDQPDKNCMYIEATLNNVVAPSNSSPSFLNNPVSFLCIGQGNFLNPGTVEPDGDAVQFALTTPKTSRRDTVIYIPPFSVTSPLSSNPPFSLNSSNGNISINPTTDNITVTAIRVEERRNGVLVGSVMRDMQLIPRNCNNANPVLSGINNTSADVISVCAGSPVCFFINGSDTDIGQNLTLTWNHAIDSGTFVVTGTPTAPRGKFCWKTKLTDVGQYSFTVTVKDDFCPVYGSATKSYKVIVNPNPIVKLPADTIIPCNSSVTLTPTITLGPPPYFYKWKSGELTSSVTKGQGTWSVTVTDGNGCAGSDTIKVSTGIIAGFIAKKLCIGQTSSFTDTSKTLAPGSSIVSWAWNFGDPASGINNTSALQNPSHHYTTSGAYNVTLRVTDDHGCIGTVTKRIKFCDIPKADFKYLDSCRVKPLPYMDLTTVTTCGIKEYEFNTGDGRPLVIDTFPTDPFFSLPFYPGFPTYYFPKDPPGVDLPPDTGTFNVTLIAINENGCRDTITKPIKIYINPVIDILESDFFFKCDDSLTVLHCTYGGGTPPLSIQWSTGATTDSIVIDRPGTYSVSVSDKLGCIYGDEVKVIFPLEANFVYTPYCEPSDPINFLNTSKFHWPITNYDWDFGDASTGTGISTSHVYTNDSIYNPRLIVIDATGCKDTLTRSLIHVLPDNNFFALPSPLCLGQPLIYDSPHGKYIDSLVWSFGNGDSVKLNKKTMDLTTVPDTSYSYKSTYAYTSGAGNTFPVHLKMIYNNKGCVRNYSTNINLFPALEVTIDSISGFCSGDSTRFYASQKNISTPPNPVVAWNWMFYYRQPVPPFAIIKVDSSTVQNPAILFSSHSATSNFFADLTVTNSDGCELTVERKGFSIVKLPLPTFCPSNRCATQLTKFFFFCNAFPEVAIDSVHWDFGDGGTATVQEPFHIYADSGLYNVRVAIFNTKLGCSMENIIPTQIFRLPQPDFTYDTVCLGGVTHFTDLSTVSQGESITDWNWNFGDGNTSAAQNPDHLYADTGKYIVRLIVTSTTGCSDTIVKTSVVRPVPNAGFIVNVNELVTGKPILFVDQSIGGVKWLWNFGDGTSSLITDPLSRNPEHTYGVAVKSVDTEQIVYNQYNCTDTAKMHLELNVYFVLPNAFSPNGDGANDGFHPNYKGIEKLEEFRIYDRWGQMVFNGDGDLKSVWDGKHKGVDQPLGVYVVYAKAIAFNQQEYVYSGKVTLIR